MNTPSEILAADKLVERSPDLRRPSAGLFLWSLTVGALTFHRYRDSLQSRRKGGTSRTVWCRIDDIARWQSTKPTPKAFLSRLQKAISA